jgi:hypothetical protein
MNVMNLFSEVKFILIHLFVKKDTFYYITCIILLMFCEVQQIKK